MVRILPAGVHDQQHSHVRAQPLPVPCDGSAVESAGVCGGLQLSGGFADESSPKSGRLVDENPTTINTLTHVSRLLSTTSSRVALESQIGTF